jgi:predicted  nucleic acid-binding Zn-ribbon protein
MGTHVMSLRPLLAVQALDTKLTQLRHRLGTLPEKAALMVSTAALADVDRQLAECDDRLQAIERRVGELESAGTDLDAKKSRFEAQLKTVIAPREAEALQHEIAIVVAKHAGLDDEELELLEESERLAARRSELEALRAARATVVAADTIRADDAAAEVARTIDATTSERAAAVATIDAALLAKYDAARPRSATVTIAEVTKNSCSGCHTALSPKEIGELKALGAGEDPRCPYCGCLLVV